MSLEMELFKLIKKREYAAALRLLETNGAIDINVLDEEGSSLFMVAVENRIRAPEERYTFIETLLSRPDFQHADKPLDGFSATPFSMAIVQNDSRLVELIVQYKDAKGIQVIYEEKDKLLYEEQAKTVQYTKNNPSSSFKSPLAAQEQILAILLKVTVHHAINTDDSSILQELANAGAKLNHPLNDGTYLVDLIRSQNKPEVHQWLSNYFKELIHSDPKYFLAASYYTDQLKQEKRAILEKAQEETRTDILEAINELQAIKFFRASAQQPEQSNEPKKPSV